MTTRRGFLGGVLPRALLLAGGVGGVWLLRDRVWWPTPQPVITPDAEGAWLDFASPQDRLPTVEATVNGTPVRVLIDSGAQYSAMDAALAERLDAASAWSPPMVAYGAGGGAQMGRAARIDVAVGGVRLDGLRTAVLELGPLASADGLGTPLILGHDVMRGLVVDIDVRRRRLRFLPPGTRTPVDAKSIPTRDVNRALMATVQVEGRDIEVVVDTGASGVLTLGAEEAGQLGLLDGRPLRGGQSVVLGGVIEARIASVRELRVGERLLTDVPVAIYANQRLPGFPAGLLGLGAFADQIMRLDIGGAGRSTRPAAELTVG